MSGGLERDLQRFEREEWGTNDFHQIIDAIIADEMKKARERLTGMEEEQADWDADLSADDPAE